MGEKEGSVHKYAKAVKYCFALKLSMGYIISHNNEIEHLYK